MALKTANDLLEMARAYQVSQALYVATRLGVPDLLAGGPRSCAALAAAAGADAKALFRLLRVLASRGILAEGPDEAFALRPIAHLLRRDVAGSVRDQVLLWGDPMQWAPWGELEYSVRTGRPAFDRHFGQGHWAYLSAHPQAEAMFKAAMGAHPSHRELPAAYDFGASRVVDVGGGEGRLLAEILKTHPHARGLLLDRPEVVVGAHAVLDAAGVGGRCAVIGGDFFDDMPTGADVYILSNVLMDWDDADAVRLLARCRDAARADGAVLVVERVVPRRNARSLGQLGDLMGLVITGGRMRTEQEHRRLFVAAGLKPISARATPSGYAVLESRVRRVPRGQRQHPERAA